MKESGNLGARDLADNETRTFISYIYINLCIVRTLHKCLGYCTLSKYSHAPCPSSQAFPHALPHTVHMRSELHWFDCALQSTVWHTVHLVNVHQWRVTVKRQCVSVRPLPDSGLWCLELCHCLHGHVYMHSLKAKRPSHLVCFPSHEEDLLYCTEDWWVTHRD